MARMASHKIQAHFLCMQHLLIVDGLGELKSKSQKDDNINIKKESRQVLSWKTFIKKR